jgi:hypothetical protein
MTVFRDGLDIIVNLFLETSLYRAAAANRSPLFLGSGSVLLQPAWAQQGM